MLGARRLGVTVALQEFQARGLISTKRGSIVFLDRCDLIGGPEAEFFERLSKYDGHRQTALAAKLLMLTAVRTSELIGARWNEIDFERAEWRVPAEWWGPLHTEAVAKRLAVFHKANLYERIQGTPENPRGAPMVSSEGACAAYYRYRRHASSAKVVAR